MDAWGDVTDRGVDGGVPSTAAGCGAAGELAADRVLEERLAAGSVRGFEICVVGSGVDDACVDDACVDDAEMGVVAGLGVFDNGGGAVMPVAGSAGGAVAGRATGTFCGLLGG